MKIDVIIPAFNEEDSIARVIKDIPTRFINNVIVVNNNSTDKTAEKALLAGALVLNEYKQGYGSACIKGIKYLQDEPPDIVVFMDGDYSDYPEELAILVEPILDGKFDFVIGSRVLGKREKGSLPVQSRIGSNIAGYLIKQFWGVKYSDLGPFRAILFNKLIELRMNDPWYGWTVEMQIKAAKNNLRILEVPVSYRKRIGKSKVTGTVRGTVMASVIILKTIFSELLRKNNA